MAQRDVLVILCDQLRADHLRMYGCEAIPTPNLDRLVARGVVFDHALSCSPVCGPARASMLTGEYPSRHGVWTNDIPMRSDLPLLPELMNQAGYATACFGKLHHTPPRETLGFRHARQMEEGRLGADDDYLRWLKRHHPEARTIWNHDPRAQRFRLPAEAHYEHWIASECIDYVEVNADLAAPLFLWLSFQGPHGPYNPPAAYAGCVDVDRLPPRLRRTGGDICPVHRYRQTWHDTMSDEELPRLRAAYGEMIAHIDTQIGRVLAALERTGRLDRTTIVFSADHGEQLKDYDLVEKGPFPYSGSLAVPLLVANHPGLPAGGRSRQLASNIDIPATVLDAAGLEGGIGCSLSLLDLAQSRPQRSRSVLYSEYCDSCKIVDDGRYRYACYPFTGTAELFDRECDPQETRNCAGQSEYAPIEIAMLRHIVDFQALVTGVRIPGFDLIPDVQDGLRGKHPRFDEAGVFTAAFPLRADQKRKLQAAGLHPDYTDFFRDHIVLAHYGEDDGRSPRTS